MKILTFDIEDWFHILDNPETKTVESWDRYPSRLREGVDTILELLDETDQKATFFCLGWVAERYPEVVRRIVQSGYHIASHSYGHQLAYDQSPAQYREDLRRSIRVLEDLAGQPVECYRAPGFSITSENYWAFEIMAEEGIRTDCSIFPANRAHGGLPKVMAAIPSIGILNNTELRLFPINTKRILGQNIIYSGGGYFRLLPERQIKKWFDEDRYVMTYFHPRDFDNDQPMIPGLSMLRRFKSYVGIRHARQKLSMLLRLHKFVDVQQATATISWSKAPKIDLRS